VNRLSDAIKTTDEMLRSIAEPKSLFPPILSDELVEMAKVKIWECKMQRQRLETSNAAEWWTYFRRVWEFMRDVEEGRKAVELVRRDTRVRDFSESTSTLALLIKLMSQHVLSTSDIRSIW
jgi:hypothetical protein